MAPAKRFSLRHGIEPIPDEPIIEAAPDRLRYFVLEFLKNNFYDYIALETVSRSLCLPELISDPGVRAQAWTVLHAQIFGCEWWALYNLLEVIYQDLPSMGSGRERSFVAALNAVLAEESVGWRMDLEGELQRLLPEAAAARQDEVFRELQAPRFASAWTNMLSAYTAYNARPRRDQDVCSAVFDALESVAKEIFSMPKSTYGDVIKEARKRQTFSAETLSVLERLYALASAHFRHGMTEPFKLIQAEVEFVYLTCIGAILMFLRVR